MKKILFACCVLTIFIPKILFSQSQEPLNSNYLIEHGVSPRVLDAAASSLIQEGSFHQNLEIIEKSSDGKERRVEMELIYDPEYKYGMDLLYVVEGDNLSKKEKKEYAAYISSAHYFSRMAKPYLYY